MRLIKSFLLFIVILLFSFSTSFASTQGLTTYTLVITEIEGTQHSFTAQVNKYVDNKITAQYDVSNSIKPVYSSPVNDQTQFQNNSSLINTANTVFTQNSAQQLIISAGSVIQQYGVSNVSINMVYAGNVYNPATGGYSPKWAVDSVLYTPNMSNFAAFDPADILSKSTGWIVTNPNPYVAVITYFTHNVNIGIQKLPNYSSTIAPILDKYLGNLLVQIYQLTSGGLGGVVATPLNTNVSAQTAYNAGFEVNTVDTTTTYDPQVLVTNLINYVNNQYIAPYDPEYIIVNYVDDWNVTTDSNGNIQLSMSYSLRQLNGTCQANYNYGSGGCSYYCGWWGCRGMCFSGGSGWAVGSSTAISLTNGVGWSENAIWGDHRGWWGSFLSYGYLSECASDVSTYCSNYFNLFSLGSYSSWFTVAGAGEWGNGFSYNQGWFNGGGGWIQILSLNATNCNAVYYNNINFYVQGLEAEDITYLVPEPLQPVQSSDGTYYAMQQISDQIVNPTALNSGNLSSGAQYAVNVSSINPNNVNFNNIIIDPFANDLCDYTISSGTDSLGYGACSFDTSLITSIVPVTNSLVYQGQGCAPGLTYSDGYCVMPATTFWNYTNVKSWSGYTTDQNGNELYCTYYYYSNPYSYQACPQPFYYSNGYCYAPATTGVQATLNIGVFWSNGFWGGTPSPWVLGWGNYSGGYTSPIPATNSTSSCSQANYGGG